MKYAFFPLFAFLLPVLTVFATPRFADDLSIPEWTLESVYTARENNIMTGFSDGNFRPNENINRAQALTIITRTIPVIQTKTFTKADAQDNHFKDVPFGTWFHEPVLIGLAEGWVKGYTDGTMRPERNVTRAEWATMLVRALNMTESTARNFTDVAKDDWFYETVQIFNHYGLIYGKESEFKPHLAVTRAEAAWSVAEILKRPEFQQWYVEQRAERDRYERLKRIYAVRRADFNPNDQGFDPIESGLKIALTASQAPIQLTSKSDWTDVGQIKLTNNLKNLGQLETLTLALVFSEGSGIESDYSLLLRFPDSALPEKIVQMDNDGIKEILGLGVEVPPNAERTIEFAIKPSGARISREASLGLQLMDAEARMWDEFGKQLKLPTVREGTLFTPLMIQP